jgi:hypothetical protein
MRFRGKNQVFSAAVQALLGGQANSFNIAAFLFGILPFLRKMYGLGAIVLLLTVLSIFFAAVMRFPAALINAGASPEPFSASGNQLLSSIRWWQHPSLVRNRAAGVCDRTISTSPPKSISERPIRSGMYRPASCERGPRWLGDLFILVTAVIYYMLFTCLSRRVFDFTKFMEFASSYGRG